MLEEIPKKILNNLSFEKFPNNYLFRYKRLLVGEVKIKDEIFYPKIDVKYGLNYLKLQLSGQENIKLKELRGKHLFKYIIDNVKMDFHTIHSTWTNNDQYYSFIRNTKINKMSDYEAAKNSFTGKMAQKIGFDELEVKINKLEQIPKSIQVKFYNKNTEIIHEFNNLIPRFK